MPFKLGNIFQRGLSKTAASGTKALSTEGRQRLAGGLTSATKMPAQTYTTRQAARAAAKPQKPGLFAGLKNKFASKTPATSKVTYTATKGKPKFGTIANQAQGKPMSPRPTAGQMWAKENKPLKPRAPGTPISRGRNPSFGTVANKLRGKPMSPLPTAGQMWAKENKPFKTATNNARGFAGLRR